MDSNIQIHGRLGIPAEKVPAEPAGLPEVNEQLAPRYTIQQQPFPKTGETNQAYFFSLLGLLLVILAVWISRKIAERL